MDGEPGFVKLDVLSPRERPAEIWLITYRSDEDSYRSWRRNHRYREAHPGLPKGLKLVPKSADFTFFDHVAS